MESQYNIRKPWHIPKVSQAKYDQDFIENLIRTLDRFEGGSHYMLDYFEQKITVASPLSPILCGHPKELVEKEGFLFFNRIIDKNVLALRIRRDKAYFDYLYHIPEMQRQSVILSNDLSLLHLDQKETIWNHKSMPFLLDKNGNVWLALCRISASSATIEDYSAIMINKTTGERFDYIDNTFVLTDLKDISPEEMQVLKKLVKHNSKQICKILNISESTLKRMKRRLCVKLGVSDAISLIHRAHSLGLI